MTIALVSVLAFVLSFIFALGGLMVSTFLTMVYVPILYSLFEDAELAVKRFFHRGEVQPQEA